MNPLAAQDALALALDERVLIKNLLFTAVLLAGVLGARALVLKALRTRNLSGDEYRRYTASTRSIALVIFVVGGGALWFSELKVFALSLAAVAAAVVIATKELIMCVSGTFMRTSSRSFEIGDRIEIGGHRGDVIDATLLSTTLLEIGPGHVGHQRTGRAITLPSSIFLSQPVVNESFTDAYVLHTFSVVVTHDGAWEKREKALLAAAETEMAPYAAEAKAFFERMSRERAIETPTQEPRVLLQIDNPTSLTLICRLPTPARRKGRIEQAILRRYLAAGSTP
jgi:small-conductance mechanosensitive channel